MTTRRADLADDLRGWSEARRHDLSHVERFVIFAGWPRSSHSLIGSLLTAHPDAAIAHELNALSYLDRGVSRKVLFGLLLRQDRTFAAAGSEWNGYSYAVPGQWQGRYRDLRVVGDKKGGRTSQLLHARPHLLEALRRTVAVPVHVVVVTRHPLDNIARMTAETERAESDASTEALLTRKIAEFFAMADAVAWLSNEAEIHWIVSESFVTDPRPHLTELVRALDLELDEDHLASASGIVDSSPRLARDAIEWPPGRAEAIMERASAYPFLAGY